ncbi:MAG: MBL fold metallo-hydrolase [Betaproteobacteria bacterium]|nr:MBL fold metallo-hydrolase [Betaproteobacteria bacterium]
MSVRFHQLAPNVTVIERGWLNCNQVVLASPERNVLIDSGYGRSHHAVDTLKFVDQALQGEPLHWLINTHCHSDHMGGNHAVREHYDCRVTIPFGEVKHVVPWTAQSCWSEQMDQYAEEFVFDDTMTAGDSFDAGGLNWQAHAAPGHDMDALIFYAPEAGIVVTGDALWEKGLGFIWPERVGAARSEYVLGAHAALDTIEKLKPKIVVPGHGAPFAEAAKSIADARSKLDAFERDPVKNARHVAKIMFVFALLDKESMPMADVPAYLESVPVYRQLREEFLGGSNEELVDGMLRGLIASGAVVEEGGYLRANMRA